VRPAVDTLFRSAAHTHGPNVVAVVLSGTLDDGTAGLVAVKSHGGVTVAQDPADAAFPGMPDSAVRFARPAHVAPVRDIAALVSKCVRANADADQAGPDQASRQDERMDDPNGLDEPDELDSEHAAAADQEGVPSELNCPECGGTLWEREEGRLLRFRCRVGHAYSPESLFSDQLESLEGALWTAVVALQERGDLAMRLANRMTGRGQHERALRYEHQAADARRRADQVRTAILQLSRSGDHLEHAPRAAAPPRARKA
jgi:two-component system chemotaxis response regulator CheB